MVNLERALRRRCSGRFFGRRVNCEQVPLLPAWAVAQALDGPKKGPYVLAWEHRSHGGFQEAVLVVRGREAGAVELVRSDRTVDFIRSVFRTLRNGGSFRLLICPSCLTPRRGLYPWTPDGRFTTSVVSSPWRCRTCNGLRYSSEGGALVVRGRLGRLLQASGLGPSTRPTRPEPWYPYVFTSPDEAARAGIRLSYGAAP